MISEKRSEHSSAERIRILFPSIYRALFLLYFSHLIFCPVIASPHNVHSHMSRTKRMEERECVCVYERERERSGMKKLNCELS